MRKLFVPAVLCLLLAAPPPAAARGIYVGVGLGNDVEGGSFRSGLEEFTESSGDRGKLFAGVELGRYWAIEAARYDLGSQSCCRMIADLAFESDVDGISLAAMGRWPSRFVTPYVKAGVLSWEEDAEFSTLLGSSRRTADGEEVLYGVGVEVDLLSRLGLRLEWERYEFDDASTDGVWLSAVLKFGGR